MARIVGIRSFQRKSLRGANIPRVKVDVGGDRIKTVEHFAPAGDDAQPLTGDYGVIVQYVSTGREAILGYADIKNRGLSAAGEKRIYSRDADGESIAEIWLKNTGEIVIKNEKMTITASGAGALNIQAKGEINLNGVTISPAGDVVAPTLTGETSVKVGTSELIGHTHAVTTAPGVTGPLV